MLAAINGLGDRMDAVEKGQGQAAMDARVENVGRDSAYQKVLHLTGAFDHSSMTSEEFYTELNSKCGVPHTEGNAQVAFDAALKFLPTKPEKIAPTGLDGDAKKEADSFFASAK